MKHTLIYFLLFPAAISLLQGCSSKSTRIPAEQSETVSVTQQTSGRLWKDPDTTFTRPGCPGKILPLSYRLLELDTAYASKELIVQGPEPGLVSKETFNIEIPLPDGTWEQFTMTQVQVMAPELAAKYPYLKTYAGTSTVYPADQIRLEAGPNGVSAMILSTRGSIMLDPFCKGDKIHMISYFRKNLPAGKKEFEGK